MPGKADLNDYARHYVGVGSEVYEKAREKLGRDVEQLRLSVDVSIIRKNLRPGDVLDFPVGQARIFDALKTNHSMWAYDVSPYFIEMVQERYPDMADRCAICSLEEPVLDRTFDNIVTMRVLDRVADLDTVIGSVARLLKPDGVWIFNLANECLIKTELEASIARAGLTLQRLLPYDWLSNHPSEITAVERWFRGKLSVLRNTRILGMPIMSDAVYCRIDRMMPRKGSNMIVVRKCA